MLLNRAADQRQRCMLASEIVSLRKVVMRCGALSLLLFVVLGVVCCVARVESSPFEVEVEWLTKPVSEFTRTTATAPVAAAAAAAATSSGRQQVQVINAPRSRLYDESDATQPFAAALSIATGDDYDPSAAQSHRQLHPPQHHRNIVQPIPSGQQQAATFLFAKKYAMLGNTTATHPKQHLQSLSSLQASSMRAHVSKHDLAGSSQIEAPSLTSLPLPPPPVSLALPPPPAHNQHQHQHQHQHQPHHQNQYPHKLQPPPPPYHQLVHNHHHQLVQHTTRRKPQASSLLEKICIGTSNRLAEPHNKSEHYQNLVERYKDCTYVIGNLEITGLERNEASQAQQLFDLSFLESIREITGYLLIASVAVERIRMPNLQIIRGRDLFKLDAGDKDEFALLLFENELTHLELPNLREILAGSVGSYNNRNLCHLRTINWDEILNWPMYRSVFVFNGTEPECAACDSACQGSCWGEGVEMCQKFSKVACSPACGAAGRCFGPAQNECCHSYCAGGCTGSNQTDCLSCKNFYDDGACVEECPSMMRYNPSKFLWEPNPVGKYAFGATCVHECPEHMLRDTGACVRVCPPNKRSFNGECVPCGGPCPKNCQGVEVVHSDNIDQLINCTVIEGSITINDDSFAGYTEWSATTNTTLRHRPMHPSRLEAFKTLREITGFLNIRAKHADFKDLSHFTNLKTIGGRQTTDMFHVLSITRTSLVSLNLRSLRKIRTGKITIEDNADLCFADTIDWRQLDINRKSATSQPADSIAPASASGSSSSSSNSISISGSSSGGAGAGAGVTGSTGPTSAGATGGGGGGGGGGATDDFVTIRNNAEASKCRAAGLVCHEQCARDGCWGRGPDECLSCNNYKLDDYCVSGCNATLAQAQHLSYEESAEKRICKRCHAECKQGCFGTEARQCLACKNVKDGPYCVPECPSHKYNNGVGICVECHKSCVHGCTGPSNHLGEGGCNSCAKTIIRGQATGNIQHQLGAQASSSSGEHAAATVAATNSSGAPHAIECMRAEDACPDGYYQEYVVGSLQPDSSPLKAAAGRPVCRKCHHRCKRCIGMGTHKTVCECAKYVAGEQCEDHCPRDYYADEQRGQCVRCSTECNGCYGPTEAECISCRVYRIYADSHAPPATPAPPTTSPHPMMGSGAPLASVQAMQQVDLSFADAAVVAAASGAASNAPRFNCTAQCPPNKPHRISESNMLDPYCSEDMPSGDTETSLFMSLGWTGVLLLIISAFAFMLCVSVYRCQIEKDKTVKLTMHLSGIDDVEPLTPSHMKPNLGALRSIKETELRRGNVLGKGYGGTVYQGFWYPEGQEHKIAVAIKVLRDNGQSNMNKEFLDEAYIMASVDHKNLVRLLAVCTTPNHLMLVTQLMPLGCLLDYVRKNQQDIGAKNLLEWGKQIARGMAYLEEHRLVHRDLALRNVLLKKTGHALISDFGLAKFLEADQSEYQSGGGRWPIRWLAPECIRERKFTHKSDVWAFGVTVWELVTFGQDAPYKDYETKDVPVAIEKGARLHQPNYVTAEVYKVMYSCWFYSPDDRPSFKSLAQNFVQFARDPERYLICGSKCASSELCKNLVLECASNHHDDKYSSGSDDDSLISGADDEVDGDSAPPTAGSPSASSQPPLSASSLQPDLTPSTHNRLNEQMFGFEQPHTPTIHAANHHHLNHHHRNHGPVPPAGGGNHRSSGSCTTTMTTLSTPTHKKNMFPLHPSTTNHSHHHHQMNPNSLQGSDELITADANNNLIPVSNNNSCWTMHHGLSANSLGHRSEQPTDMYDYLMPSPCAKEQHVFGTYYSASFEANAKSIPRNPPLSAGLTANISNEEYFFTHTNYANSNTRLSTSNGNVPSSLV